MGLIGWIKKEIESSSRQRRQSAPPPIAISLTSPNQHRDEAYLRAISKFNEWRNNQRFERLNETKNASAITNAPTTGNHSIMTDDFSLISDVAIDDGEKRRLIQMQRNRKKQESDRRHEQKATIYTATTGSKNHRLSLPIMQEISDENSHRRRSRKGKVHPSNTIDEIEEFEQNHCRQMDDDYSIHVNSPPSRFYRDNSEPYTTKTSETKQASPKRQSLMGRNMLRRAKCHGKGKAPQPPSFGVEASPNFHNGNFKHYEVTSGSVYDEFLKASKNYKASMRKQEPEKINSVGESTSSGSLSSDPEKNIKKQRRLSPPYQTVINKHGEEVEYALPYSERDSPMNLPPLPTSAPPRLSQSKFDQIINENFKFLHSNLEFFNAEESLLSQKNLEAAFEPIETSFSDIRRKAVQVTDLDKSNDTGLVTPAQSGADIMKDIDALSTWTKNLKNCDKNWDIKSPIAEYQAIQNNIKVFDSNEIKFKSGVLRNSFSTPLEFSNGYFHTTPVTLRSTLPNVYSMNSFADVASKREFEVLTQLKHQSIVTLMGICHDNDLHVTSLVMEPFDFTLNHYLHQMDQQFSIQQTISIVLQVASATQYLHECGLVHSNISSHAVLIREAPFAVKLSSFELTTEILPRKSIGKIFHPQPVNDEDKQILMNESADAMLREKYYKLSKQHFYNQTSLPVVKYAMSEENSDYRLPYSVAYRRMFSMHYYQAPELLIPSNNLSFNYVMPSTRSDTFGLSLLLWESLNHCVPFVLYNHDELILAYKKNDAKLPLLDKSSTSFIEIFDNCLRVNSNERISDVSAFMSMLHEIHQAGDGKKKLNVQEIIVPARQIKQEIKETKKNFKNAKFSEKVPEKIYFTRSDLDPQLRIHNAITAENLLSMGVKDSSRVSESVKSSEIDAHLVSFNQQPGILQDDELDRIKKTVEDQHFIAPKKPFRMKDDIQEAFEISKRSLTDSTMYQSFFDYNRLHTPKVDKDVIYERTSTLKKRLKAPEALIQKKSVKGLFEQQSDVFDKMNNELSQIVQDYDKDDFMNEIVHEINERQKTGRDEVGLSSFLNRAMASNLQEQSSHSSDELPKGKLIEMPKMKRSESENVGDSSAYHFAIGEYSLPKTPIARQNKIRRNAWLSDSKKPAGGRNSDVVAKPNKSSNDLKVTNNSPDIGAKVNRKQYNVSIKIHHNDLDATPKPISTNKTLNDSSINIKLLPLLGAASPLSKVNNFELNSSRYPIDINRKYYPMMPEMLSDVIQNKRDRSGFLHVSQSEFNDKNVWRREEVEENVIVPVRTSVREAVKYIESTFKSPMGSSSPARARQSSVPCEYVFSTPTSQTRKLANEETQTEMFFTPTTEFPRVETDDVSECLIQASESIQRLNEIFQTSESPAQGPQSMPIIVNKRLENVANPTPKKITTKVTVNLKKISRRSSDVGHLKQVQEQSRHSICNNAELIKRIQMHFKAKDPSLQISKKYDEISASCSSLVQKEKNSGDVSQQGKCPKYFCRNCGFTMLPLEVLQKMKNSGRLSIASSLAESLQSIRHEEGSQSMMTLQRRCHPISETKSTEDLYIDDDFCQGISQSLAANMELLPSQDFFESLDFNFLTAEIFHTQEHEFDYTLCEPADGEQMQLEWHGSDEEGDDQVLPVTETGIAISATGDEPEVKEN